jgi:hypothetical protein
VGLAGSHSSAGVCTAVAFAGEAVRYAKGKSSRQLQADSPHLLKRYWDQRVPAGAAVVVEQIAALQN